MKKRFLAWLLLLAMLLCTACGNSKPESATPATSDNNQPASTPSSGETTAEPTSGEKIFRIAMEDTTLLDPMTNWQIPSYYFYWTVYERLIKLNYDTGEYEPELATSWEVTEDGSAYTFHLREGVKWHDGKDFTSVDVKYTIERGIELGTGNYPGVDYVEAIDEHTVVVHMLSADSVFLDKQWTGDCCIMQDGADESSGQFPIGTGPYKFEEWLSGDHITISRFEDYWGDLAPNDKIIFSIIPEASSRLVALQSGDIDLSPISSTDVKHVEADENLIVLNKTGIWLDQLGMNCEKGPLADVRVRKAIAHAINRQAIIDGVLEGYGTVMNTPIAMGKVGYYDGVEPYDYDVEKAKALLAEAGYPNGGFELGLAIYSYPLVAQLIQYDLSQIGITVKISEMEKTAQLDYVKSGDQDLFFWGRSGGPADIYVKSFSAKSTGSVAANTFNYQNDKIDELYEQTHLTLDVAKRNDVYKEIQIIVMDELPTLPLFAADVFTGQAKNVTGFVPDSEGCHDYRTVTFAK